MIEQVFEIIKILEVILLSILFIVYPYFIFYIYSMNYDDEFNWYIYIPGLTHIVSIIMIIMIFAVLLKNIIEQYYKIRYRVNKETIKLRKTIDPFDEEDWEDEWKDKIKTNKFYNKLIE